MRGLLLLLAGAAALEEQPGEGGDVVQVTYQNWESRVMDSGDPVLVEFYTSWCGVCKDLAPEWARAATQLKGLAVLASIDAEQNRRLATEYNVKSYPTILYFPPGDKVLVLDGPDCEDDPGFECDGWDQARCRTDGDTEVDLLSANEACCVCGGGARKPPPQSLVLEYNAKRTERDIVDWMFQKLESAGIQVQIPEMTDQATFEKMCILKKYCVLTFLPHLYDTGAAGREQMLSVISDMAFPARMTGAPIGFGWVQGGSQEKFEERFQLDSGYPSVLVINKDRQICGTHAGPFTSDSVAKTLRSMQSGLLPTRPCVELPKMVKTVPWDGGEYRVLEEEEEDEYD